MCTSERAGMQWLECEKRISWFQSICHLIWDCIHMTRVMVTLCITRFKISSFLIIIYCGEISYVNSLFSLHCYYYYKFETKESWARSKTILTCFFPSSHHFITSNFNQLRSGPGSLILPWERGCTYPYPLACCRHYLPYLATIRTRQPAVSTECHILN